MQVINRPLARLHRLVVFVFDDIPFGSANRFVGVEQGFPVDFAFADSGIFGVAASTGEDEVTDLLPVVVDELLKATETITDEEVIRVRNQIRAGLLMSLESPSSRAGQLARQQIQNKLQAEGLFDPDRKRPLPRYPPRIVLITSTALATFVAAMALMPRKSVTPADGGEALRAV